VEVVVKVESTKVGGGSTKEKGSVFFANWRSLLSWIPLIVIKNNNSDFSDWFFSALFYFFNVLLDVD